MQILRVLHTEARTDFSRVSHFAILVVAQMQSADRTGPGTRGGIADDHEFLTLDAFGFEPVLLPAGTIRGIREFGDDPFEPYRARFGQYLSSLRDHVIAIMQVSAVARLFQKVRKHLFAGSQGF